MMHTRKRYWLCVVGLVATDLTFALTTPLITGGIVSRKGARCWVFRSTSTRRVGGASTMEIDIESLNRALEKCTSGTTAGKVLEDALRPSDEGNTPLFASVSIPRGASDKRISDGDLAIQTKNINTRYGIMDLIELNGDRDADRASLGLLGVFTGFTASALVANQNMPGPEILRFVVVWLLSFAPLAFVGYGIATPEELQTVLVNLQRNFFPTYRKRMIQHEAGHFLLGHLLGLPIKGYAMNAVKNAVEFHPLNDPDAGQIRARMLGFDERKEEPYESADVQTDQSSPYFSKEGRGRKQLSNQSVFRKSKNYRENPLLKLPPRNDPTEGWPYRGFDRDTIDQLAVVSVAGVCAEILAFGNAEGGYADFSQLRQLFNSAEPELDEGDMDNRIRFAIGYTMSQLRRHLGALDALADVMERGGSVAECVLAIETCSNISGQDGILGDYERRRRDEFRSEGVGILEQLLLDEKTIDVEEDRFVTGKGGGYRKARFSITGDDPFYIAFGLAAAFFLWASNGGLSLH